MAKHMTFGKILVGVFIQTCDVSSESHENFHFLTFYYYDIIYYGFGRGTLMHRVLPIENKVLCEGDVHQAYPLKISSLKRELVFLK